MCASIFAVGSEDLPAKVFLTYFTRKSAFKRFGFLPSTRVVSRKVMSMSGLEAALTALQDVGAPDYSDANMLQYLRAERVVPPYQTRGYKLVELVRIYEVGTSAVPNELSPSDRNVTG